MSIVSLQNVGIILWAFGDLSPVPNRALTHIYARLHKIIQKYDIFVKLKSQYPILRTRQSTPLHHRFWDKNFFAKIVETCFLRFFLQQKKRGDCSPPIWIFLLSNCPKFGGQSYFNLTKPSSSQRTVSVLYDDASLSPGIRWFPS